MLVTIVLGVSLALQIASALLAVRVYFRFSRRGAWLLLAAAITLMAVRRLVPFSRLLAGRLDPAPDLLGESIALVISILMFSGVAWIGPIFARMAEAERARDALLQEQYEAQHSRSLNVLAGGVAHDFNNILTAIRGHAELARADLPADHPTAAHLDEIGTACDRAADLCSELLAYAGHDLGDAEVVAPSEVTRQLIDFLGASVGRDVKLVAHTDAPAPPIEASRSRLTRVLMNLVLNAAEAVDSETGRIEITLEGRTLSRSEARHLATGGRLAPGEYAVITVADNGRGMDEETQRRVFEPFFTTKFTGRGLGLSSAFGIVRTHAGGIEIDSQPGRGTRMRVYWPAAPRPERPAPDGVRAARGERVRLEDLRVLLVDDEASLRLVGRKLLNRLGCSVIDVESGEQAVRVLEEDPRGIDVILLDYTMPGMSGMDTLAHLRELQPGIPVVVMSGFPEEKMQALLEAFPGVVFLAKPFAGSELQRAMTEALTYVTAHKHL